jgi:hypothetical protein
MSLVESKSLLARLLAAENITVEHRKVSTAYFDVKNRILVCPILKDMPTELYDLLMGHEVGHALYTPPQGWHDSIKGTKPGFKSYLNVIEDARIEKFIKDKFPGIRPSFFKGYKNLLDRDFFGIANRDVSKLPLIDRINLHFKSGSLSTVQFAAEELQWIDAIAELETWEDVVDIATALYELAQEQEAETSSEPQEEGESGEGDDTEEMGDDPFSGDEEQEDSDKLRDMQEPDSDPESITDTEFRKKEQELVDEKCKPIANTYLPTFDMTNRIVGYKQVYANFAASLPTAYPTLDAFYTVMQASVKEFNDRNMRYINLLVKEFELNKNAKQFARASVSKTGQLDMNKIASYRLSEDLFKRVTEVPQGKNHGLLLFLDLSGSMNYNMEGCLEQILILAIFCRKVNIPFRVLGFSDTKFTPETDLLKDLQKDVQNYDLFFDEKNFRLREYLSSSMSRTEFAEAQKALLSLMKVYQMGLRGLLPQSEKLNGTPINEAIIASIDISLSFRRQYKLEVLTTMFITDGQANANYIYIKEQLNNGDFVTRSQGTIAGSYKYNTSITHRASKTKIVFNGDDNATPHLAAIAQKVTGANYVGFFIADQRYTFNKNVRELQKILNAPQSSVADKLLNQAKKDKFFVFDNVGFNNFFVVPGGQELKVQNTQITVGQDATKADLKKAFSRALTARATSRAFLLRFCNSLVKTL